MQDGSTRDVTRQAAYDLGDPSRFAVSVDGLVHARGPGEVAIAVRYRDGRATSRLAFPADRPGFAWRGGEAEHPVDQAVYVKLRALRINPSPPADDPVFVRRAYLDAIGRLPDPAETRAFLRDKDSQKRSKLVDRLVDRPEFADFWALKWADVLRNEEKTMGEKGAWVFHRWLRDELRPRRPARRAGPPDRRRARLDLAESPRELLPDQSRSDDGGGERRAGVPGHPHPVCPMPQPPVRRLDPGRLLRPVGVLLEHRRKELDNVRKDRLDKHEINGDEIIYLAGPPRLVHPRTGATLQPTVLHGTPGQPGRRRERTRPTGRSG